MTSEEHRTTYNRLQDEAASRPGSRRVRVPGGEVWMSPIEVDLYEAMLREGLQPVPQHCIKGYVVDFAFPDVRVAVEADGAEYHGTDRRERDRKRDWILRNDGWTVKRFHGTTIYHRAANCAYVVKREVEGRRAWAAELARQEELRRQARRDAFLRPFRAIARLLRRTARKESADRTVAGGTPPPEGRP